MSQSQHRSDNSNRHGEDCRTCTDFKTWARKQKERLNYNKTPKQIENDSSDDLVTSPKNCPLDKDALGNATWSLLHTIGATYPDNPTDDQKKDAENFVSILSRIYPCEYCAKDLRKDLRELPIDVSSQNGFSQWLCKLHNRVNEKLGKPIFDCSKVNERWRDGWSDGSCN